MDSVVKINNIKIIQDPKNWLKRDNLLLPALTEEEAFRLDDRSMSDIIVFTKKLANLIKYYNLSGDEVGYWNGFLRNINVEGVPEHAELINKLEKNQLLTGDIAKLSSMLDPHEVLFLAFLSLMHYPRSQINNFSQRYLDYYYSDYLGFVQKPITPAKAHVTFELNKDASSVILEQGTLLSAGVDSKRKEIFYTLPKDLLVTPAQITNIQILRSSVDKKGEELVVTTIFDQAKDGIYTPKTFKTFGEKKGIPAKLGFAISSPILASSAGTRTLTLIINGQDNKNIVPNIKGKFTFYATGEKGWVKLSEDKTDALNQIQLILDQAIVYPEEYDAEINFYQKYPILKAVLTDLTAYQSFKDIQLKNIQLKLEVKDVSNLKMANDETTLNADDRSIHPFGMQPIIGSSFYFTHPDLMDKTLSSLKLEMKWLGLPKDDFQTYYKDYFKQDITNTIVNSSFQTELIWSKTSLSKNNELFLTSEKTLVSSTTIDIYKSLYANKLTNLGASTIRSDNPIDWSKYFRLSLEHDFLHSIYPKVSIEGALANPRYIPNPPYTPTCSSITASYIAEDTIEVQQGLQFNHFGPWVVKGQNTIIPIYEDIGYLFLGITDLERGAPLSMLWQASGEVTSNNNQVSWEYLSKQNNWEKFTNKESSMLVSGTVEDATGNFSGSGIITFYIPDDISNDYPIKAGNQYWIRATLNQKSQNEEKFEVLDTLDIRLHASVALFDKQNQTQDNYSMLKPESIQGLVKEVPNIQKVLQPYPGFDGKEAESEQEFKIRSGARLKHKNRAITAWDYERLVLTAFPEVYMVKVGVTTPGTVTIEIVVRASQDQFVTWPNAPEQLLNRIKAYLQEYKSAAVLLQVTNAKFSEINIETEIRFTEQNQGLIARLDHEVRWFLSPWSNSDAIDLDRTSNNTKDIYQPEVVNFIKTRDYVNQVISFK